MRTTHILIALILTFFFVLAIFPPHVQRQIFLDYGFSGTNLLEGRLWVFITSMFLHGSVAHLILNLIALFFFGLPLEEEISRRKFLAIFFLGGIAGNLILLFVYPLDQLSIGASGGIFAIMGYAMLIKPFEFALFPYLVPVPIALVGMILSIYAIIGFLTVGAESEIAYAAHLGGLFVGFALGLREERSRRGIIILIATFILLLFTNYIWDFLNLVDYTDVIIRLFE
jgi:rhomboid protease GluP